MDDHFGELYDDGNHQDKHNGAQVFQIEGGQDVFIDQVAADRRQG